MSKGYFTDKTSKPTDEEILKILGAVKKKWLTLLQYLTIDLKIKGEWKFYGVNYGWALRFIKSGKSVIALYPGEKYFMAQIILNKNQIDAALSQGLSDSVKSLIENTPTAHEGKWIFLPVDKSNDLNEVFALLNAKLKVK